MLNSKRQVIKRVITWEETSPWSTWVRRCVLSHLFSLFLEQNSNNYKLKKEWFILAQNVQRFLSIVSWFQTNHTEEKQSMAGHRKQ